jgi:integrase
MDGHINASVRAVEPVTVTELVSNIQDVLALGPYSPDSASRLGDLMRRFAAYASASGVKHAWEVDVAVVESFVRARSSDGSIPAVATMHLRRAAVRLLFFEGRKMGVVNHDPTLDLVLPPRSSLPTRPLTDDEIGLCRSHSLSTMAETRQPAAWALAEATARSGDLARIRIEHLELDRDRVWIVGSSRTDHRWGHLSDWGRTQILRRIEAIGEVSPHVPIVCRRAKEGISATSSASKAIAETMRRANLHQESDVRPGSVAAWAGAKAFSEGASIEDVALMLGIRSLDRAATFIGHAWRDQPEESRGP